MANRYWVGGGSSNNWDATTPTNWSSTSGGTNDASVPDSVDQVFFNANSGSGNSIISSDISILSLNCTGYVGTLTHQSFTLSFPQFVGTESTIPIIFSAGMSYVVNTDSEINISSPNSFSITSAGQTLPHVKTSGILNTLSITDNLVCESLTVENILNTQGNNITTNYADFSTASGLISNSIIRQTAANVLRNVFGEESGSASQAVGQSFTATSTSLKHVFLNIKKVGTITDDLRLEISTTIDGAAFASTTITPDTVIGDIKQNLFTFSSAVALTVGVKYYLRVVKATGTYDSTNYYQVAAYFGFGSIFYSDGDCLLKGETGWVEQTSTNLYFVLLADDVTASTYTLEGTGDVWDASGLLLESTSPSIKLTDSSPTDKNFKGAGFLYAELWNETGGTGVVNVSGSNTITTLKSAADRDFTFEAGTTQTVTTVDIGENNQLYSSISGNTWTILDTTGTNTLTNATIKDSTASGGATWKNISGTDDGNNTGWIFIDFATIDTDAATDILETTATLNGEIFSTNNSSATRRGFVIGTSSLSDPGDVSPEASSYASVITETGTFTAGTFTGSATGQTRATTYYYRAFAENEAGFSYGYQVSYTTDGLPAVNLLSVDVTDAIAVLASGEITDLNGDNVVRRGFVVSTSTQTDPGDVSPEDSSYSNITSESGLYNLGTYALGVTSLEASTTYYIRAFVENSVGHSYSTETTFTTRNRPTLALPQVTARESTTADVLSEVTNSDGLVMSDRGVVYSETTQTNPGNVTPGDSNYTSFINQSGTFSIGTFTSNLTLLKQNTRHYLRSYARNNGGYTYSDEINFTTRIFPGGEVIDNQDTSVVTPTNDVVFGVSLGNSSTNETIPSNRNAATSAIINTNTANSTITNL